ncbi:unnamed protein product [Penicillium viridicatum]
MTAAGEDWLTSQLKTQYPRFFFTTEVRELTERILERLGLGGVDGVYYDQDQAFPSPNDVFLYPGGMSAINAVARALGNLGINSGVFGFGWLYTETVKILEHRWPDIEIYKKSGDEELDRLEASLKSGRQITALWVDVPSNPMLITPDMPRLRRLADKHHFLILIDGTVGTFGNVDLLPYADVLYV